MHRLLPLLLLALSVAAADPPVRAKPAKGTQYAFLVGCAGYNPKVLQPVQADATVNDVVEFRKALLATGFAAEHITLLHDKQAEKGGAGLAFVPERAKIAKKLDLFLSGLTKDDTAVVVLSGHGVHFRGDSTGYFCPLDADLSDKSTLLPFEGEGGIYTKLDRCGAGRKLLIANACRDAPVVKGTDLSGPKVELTDEYPEAVPKGIAALYSCEPGQKSFYDPKRGRSYFFLHLTDAWTAGGKLEDIFDATRTKTRDEVKKAEEQKQFPVVKRGYEGEWVIAATKERKGGDEVEFEVADGVKMTFCWIPPGKATLGSPKTEKDRSTKSETEHEYAEKAGFWLGKYPVTQEEWTAVMGTTPFAFHKDGSRKRSVEKLGGTTRFPAEQVSWNDAQHFLKAVNKRAGQGRAFGGLGTFRLPPQDRWEYACRGGNGNLRPFYWGDALNGDKANCAGDEPYGTDKKGESLGRTTAVGSYESVAPHPWGLCDMAGNVEQWCIEEHWLSGRVVRGGSWRKPSVLCRSAWNWGSSEDNYSDSIGFRVMFSVD